MKLYGSITSPFVRRIRMSLAQTDYTFIHWNIFEGPDREALALKNPTMKVPMLEDGENLIFDSGVIYRYLCEKLSLPKLSWSQENLVTLINAANDTFVQLFMLQRSGIELEQGCLYHRLQYDRVNSTLAALSSAAEQGEFDEWHYASISLFSLLDWAHFRGLYDFTESAPLKAFMEKHGDREIIATTDPRLTA